MENNFAYIKKYKSVLNLIICTTLSLLVGFLMFFAFQFDASSDEIDFWFYFDLIFSFIIFITLLSISISAFIKQVKFNRSTPKYYISLVNTNAFKINGRLVYIKDIQNISYKKIHKWELFGEIKESKIGESSLPIFKFEEKIAEKATKKAKSNYNKSIQKSNLGNIIIELKSSSKIILKRVNNLENAVNEIKNIIKEKGNM